MYTFINPRTLTLTRLSLRLKHTIQKVAYYKEHPLATEMIEAIVTSLCNRASGHAGLLFGVEEGSDNKHVAKQVSEFTSAFRGCCMGCMEKYYQQLQPGDDVDWIKLGAMCDCQPERCCDDEFCACSKEHFTQNCCSNCVEDGKECVSIWVVVVTLDCCGSQLAYMSNSNVQQPFLDFVCIPDPIHVMKSERNGAFNWFIRVKGFFCGMRVVHARYRDQNSELSTRIKAFVRLSDLFNKNKYSFETACTMVSESLQRALCTDEEWERKRAWISLTIAPETIRFWMQCKKDQVHAPRSVAFHAKSGYAFFIDSNKKGQSRLQMLKLNHVPASITVVTEDTRFGKLCDMVIRDDTVYIADYCNHAVWVVDIGSMLQPYARVIRTTKGKRDKKKDDDDGGSGDDDDDDRVGPQRAGDVRVRKLVCRQEQSGSSRSHDKRKRQRLLAECEVNGPFGLSISRPSEFSFDLLVTSKGKVSSLGGLWRLTIEVDDMAGARAQPLSLELPFHPAGVATFSDGGIYLTAGSKIYLWEEAGVGVEVHDSKDGKTSAAGVDGGGQGVKHKAAGDAHQERRPFRVVVDDVGVQLCGIYSKSAESESELSSDRVMYVFDEGGHCVYEVVIDQHGACEAMRMAGRHDTEGPSGPLQCGTGKLVSFWQPAFGCMVYNSVLIADYGNDSIRMLTCAYTHAAVLMPTQRLVAEGFGLMPVGADEKDGNANSISEAIACISLHDIALNEITQDIHQLTGISHSAQQGPEGNFSRSVRRSVKLWRTGLLRLLDLLKKMVSKVCMYEGVRVCVRGMCMGVRCRVHSVSCWTSSAQWYNVHGVRYE
jgi:hypothetical protein